MGHDMTVFISYSWEDEIHNKRVERFVARLRAHDITVLFDKDMALGERFTDFMELINQSDYVFFICTPTYKEKADRGVGGVKYEKNIITAELYENGNEKKFIPVLFSGTWSESLPVWAKGKLGIDYSGESDEAFYRLLTNLRGGHTDEAEVRNKKKKIGRRAIVLVITGIFCVLLLYFFRSRVSDVKDPEAYEDDPYGLIRELDSDLRDVLGDHYTYFLDCFYTTGTVAACTTYSDGIYMDGFVRGIADYMGGVLCVDTDGFLYVLLIDEGKTILYYTNNEEHGTTMPLNMFGGAVSDWLDDYSDYPVRFQSVSVENDNIAGTYARAFADLEVTVNSDHTITVAGEAWNGTNWGTLEYTSGYQRYPGGGYAKFDLKELEGDDFLEGQYFVLYFGDDSLTVLDRAPYLSGAGVTFEGEYTKYE